MYVWHTFVLYDDDYDYDEQYIIRYFIRRAQIYDYDDD